jgi:hypothetical protein
MVSPLQSAKCVHKQVRQVGRRVRNRVGGRQGHIIGNEDPAPRIEFNSELFRVEMVTLLRVSLFDNFFVFIVLILPFI